MAKYEGAMFTMAPSLSEFLLWEGEPIYTRDVVMVQTDEDLPAGTIVEGDGVMAKASAGTARLGMLVHGLKASAEAQEAAVVCRMACFSAEKLLVESGIKTAAMATLAKQGVKVA